MALRLEVGHGLVGAAVADGQPILVNDVHTDPRYVEAVPGSNAELVVPLRRKGRVIGALNLLSDTVGGFTERIIEKKEGAVATISFAGKSSGGFGAMITPMLRPDLFGAVVPTLVFWFVVLPLRGAGQDVFCGAAALMLVTAVGRRTGPE